MFWFARTEYVKVASSEEMQLAIARYITERFVVTQQTPTLVTLVRQVQISVKVAVLVFFIGLVALEVPFIMYVTFLMLSRLLGWDQTVNLELAEQRWGEPVR